MGRITFVGHTEDEHIVEIEEGISLMELALDNGVPGIDADCGGQCACGTCHVFVDQQWLKQIEEASDHEALMLDMKPDREGCSRLSCQIVVTNAMDGMKIRLPEFQM